MDLPKDVQLMVLSKFDRSTLLKLRCLSKFHNKWILSDTSLLKRWREELNVD